MTTFFSVDIETTTTVPTTDSYLLTIGIVPVIEVNPGEWDLHGSNLYLRFDYGIDNYPEPDIITSMPWWRTQADNVQDEAYRNKSLKRYAPVDAANMIKDYVRDIEPEYSGSFFVANPVSFDKPWVDLLFANTGVESPFHYRSLCLRSMKFGKNPAKGFGSDRESHESQIPHHALFDAEAQALDLISMLNQ